MSDSERTSQPAHHGLAARVTGLRLAIGHLPAGQLADRTGISYEETSPGKGEFRLSLFELSVRVTYPGMVALDGQLNEELSLSLQAVLVYYFHTADGTSITGEWISFADLPDGRIYDQAYQGYSGAELARVYGLQVDAFREACEMVGGVAAEIGEAAYVFHALPRLPMLVNYWAGDEEFPTTCKILFDRSASHYLPTDVCAILGSMLAKKLLKSTA